ncbi:hypothetical protein TWF102_006999 [Orbilia oligospora]|uniref:Uncharacterized protein n=1 Tax=Orbilia oligospora TaxID=2813651 RepID=A0A7C8JII3_ORBOL|nr:hypothetical protein TWF103_005873 [Orbilia oligospora]KAF3111326.1 hypothetical protein TWF102_006999 [Orbilia oligospora]
MNTVTERCSAAQPPKMSKKRSKPTMAERAALRGYTSQIAKERREAANVYCLKKLRPSSEADYKRLSKKWHEFNKFTGKPLTYGFRPGDVITTTDLKEFMRFLIEGSEGGYISEDISSHTLRGMLRKFRAAEKRWGNRTISDEMCDEVRNYIDSELSQDIGRTVPTAQRKKVHINKKEFFDVMDYLWLEDDETTMQPLLRLQLSLFTMISAFTLSRPGGLALTRGETEPTAALCYQDITLMLVQPDPNQHKLIFLLEVKLDNHKNQRSYSNLYSDVILHDSDKFRPVSQFVALAFLDDAFDADIRKPEDLISVRPLHEFGQRSTEFRWKKSHLDRPIFRNQESCAMRTLQLNYYLRTLGTRMGFRFNLTPYSVRYGVSNAMEGKTTLDRRRQALGHLKDGTWATHYMSKTLLTDLQSVFVGIETELITNEIINTTGHSRYRDTRAPQTASNSGLENAKKIDPELQELYKTLDLLRERQKTAPADETNIEIQDISLAIQSRIRRLRNKQLKEERNEFFETIHTRTINDQLRAIREPNELEMLRKDESALKIQEPLSGPRKNVAERLDAGGNLDLIDTTLVKYLMRYLKGQRSGWIGGQYTPSLKRRFEEVRGVPDLTFIGRTTVEEIHVQSELKRAQVRRIKSKRIQKQLSEIKEETLKAQKEATEIEIEAKELDSIWRASEERMDALKREANLKRWKIYSQERSMKKAEKNYTKRMEVLNMRSDRLEKSKLKEAEMIVELEAKTKSILEKLEDETRIKERRRKLEDEVRRLEAKLIAVETSQKSATEEAIQTNDSTVEENLQMVINPPCQQTIVRLTAVEEVIKVAAEERLKAKAGEGMIRFILAGENSNERARLKYSASIAQAKADKARIEAGANDAWERKFAELNLPELLLGNGDGQRIEDNAGQVSLPEKSMSTGTMFKKLKKMMDSDTWNDYSHNAHRIYRRVIGSKGDGLAWKNINRGVREGAKECLRRIVTDKHQTLQENNSWIAEFFLHNCHREERKKALRCNRRSQRHPIVP